MRIQATTGLTVEQLGELVDMVAVLCDPPRGRGRRPALGLPDRVRVTLEHLRTNAPQRVLAEHFGVSQSTICRIVITAYTRGSVSNNWVGCA